MEELDLVSLGIPKERLELFQSEIEEHKNDARFFISLGDGLVKKQKFIEAIQCYQRALAIEPALAEVWNNLGVIYISQDNYIEAAKHFDKAIRCDPTFYTAFFNLGLIYSKAGRLLEAQKSYERVLETFPNHFGAHLSLGSIFGRLGQNEKALFHYKQANKINPEHVGAQHMVSALEGKTTERAPDQYIEELFDSYSNNFEEHLRSKLQYKAPDLIGEQLLSISPADKKWPSALDLGCGTGLMAMALKGKAEKITGVDLSKKMISVAQKRNLYSQLVRSEVTSYLKKCEETFSLVTAADVFVYCGELREIFSQVSRVLLPGGLFAFSVEELEGPGYTLRTSGRYAHSADYIHSLANAFTLKKHLAGLDLRLDLGKHVKGSIFIFERV